MHIFYTASLDEARIAREHPCCTSCVFSQHASEKNTSHCSLNEQTCVWLNTYRCNDAYTIHSKPYLSMHRKGRQSDTCWMRATTVRARTHRWYCLLSNASCCCQACPDPGRETEGRPSSSQGQTALLASKLQNKDAAVRQPVNSNGVLELLLYEVGMLQEVIHEPSMQLARQM